MLALHDEAYYMSLYCLFKVTGCCFHRPSNTVSNLLSVFAGWKGERQDRVFPSFYVLQSVPRIPHIMQ